MHGTASFKSNSSVAFVVPAVSPSETLRNVDWQLVTDFSGQFITSTYKDQTIHEYWNLDSITLENGIHSLSRNVGY